MDTVHAPSFTREIVEGVPIDSAGTAVDSWVFRRPAIQTDAPPKRLLVVHGLGDAPVTWFPSLRATLPEWELVLPALPGAGRGPLPHTHDHLTFSQTWHWLQQLEHRLTADDTPTRVIGHSLGGWLHARALLDDSSLTDRVGAPILVNNAGTWYPDVDRERTLLSPKTLEDVDELMEHMYADDRGTPIEALQAMLDTMRSPGYRGLLWSTQEDDFLDEARLRALPRGTGLVWGLDDRLVPLEALERLRSMVPGIHVHELPQCGHAPHIEAPDRLVAALEDLL